MTLTPLTYQIAKPFSLKANGAFSERWLQDRIAEDPAILGLGDVQLLAAEKMQPRAGRLDLLLHDDQFGRRYEVELMLGATDPSHIIRTIEYWDIERRRYPAYEHIAVLVAEDVTSRFLNVMSLLAGTIPMIAIQLSALEVDGKVLLHFVQVLNQTELRTDDAYELGNGGETVEVDRSYWHSRIGEEMMAVCDRLCQIASEASSQPLKFKYKKASIGIALPGSFFNLWPKKGFVNLILRLESPSDWVEKFEDCGLEARLRRAKKVVVKLDNESLQNHDSILRQAISESVA